MRLAIIPARGGSVRIPKKNVRPFKGRPIIHYSIDLARRSGLFDRVMVSTDDKEVAVTSAEASAEVYWRKPDDGTRGTQDVAREVLLEMPEVTEACVIYATCPLLDVSDLDRGYALLQKRGVLFTIGVQIEPLADAGCFYWGKAEAFRVGAPLIDSHTVMVPMPARRVCDINTFDDWARAERLFDEWRGRHAING